MDDDNIKINKSKKDEINIEELLKENKRDSEVIDVSMFDDTLKEINQILKNLEQKMHVEKNSPENLNVLPEIKSAISKIYGAKSELVKEENNLIKDNNLVKRIEELEKKIKDSNEIIASSNELKNQTTSETKEHKIDQNLLSIEELHNFRENDEKKKKKSLGFYSYLILVIVIFFTLYGILNFTKELIIFKYPMMGAYIQYFYEIIEIVKVSIVGLADFFINKI
jgi:hypothetical protein